MKVTQSSAYRPVTIVLETGDELSQLRVMARYVDFATRFRASRAYLENIPLPVLGEFARKLGNKLEFIPEAVSA